MTDKSVDEDIKKIGELLREARTAGVSEVEAELPFYVTSRHYGLMTVRARWSEPSNE